MATDADFITFVFEQIRRAGEISTRKMFGEYAVYCDEKVVALACDNQLFVKPTEAGRALLGDYREGPPYPGAKLHLLIDTQLEDAELLSELIRVTAQALPLPKPKKPKPAKTAGVTRTTPKPAKAPKRTAPHKPAAKAAVKKSSSSKPKDGAGAATLKAQPRGTRSTKPVSKHTPR